MRKNQPEIRYRLSWVVRKDAFGRLIWPLQFYKSAIFDTPQELSDFLRQALVFKGCPRSWEEKANDFSKEALDFCNKKPGYYGKNEINYFREERDNVLERARPPFYKIQIITLRQK